MQHCFLRAQQGQSLLAVCTHFDINPMTAHVQDMGVGSVALDARVPKVARAVSKVPAGQQLHDMVNTQQLGQSVCVCLCVTGCIWLRVRVWLAVTVCLYPSVCICALASMACK